MMAACPWAAFRQAEYARGCEPSLCVWIVHPAETWSNRAYLAAATLVVVRSEVGDCKLPARWLSLSILIVGLASAGFHASMLYWLQALDITAIAVLIAFLLSIALQRAGLVRRLTRWNFRWCRIDTSGQNVERHGA
jgi:hypothetical protein